ncbi:MerR family transcriptional regulator [Brucella intermedia]|uniref:MerR family transcriptional regulator n=1 Tax=Brucella intermedia M86 TaxID=1234597 RepID=M5JSR7_9HYPH|nr:helix-turn-helix domain-containing protein [Brucella intermedia]ELT51245.1 MerR family transcriptional regulator [Brucella intermedia M86]
MAASYLSIGQLASQTRTKVETIRFYEKSGLLPAPVRTKGNYRAYETDHLNRLSFIRRARDLGFSLDQIKALLALSDDRTRSCAEIDRIAGEHRAEVERKIIDLMALKAELDRMIDRCGHGVVADCRIIETLSPSATRDI